jgi:hypothetical protein
MATVAVPALGPETTAGQRSGLGRPWALLAATAALVLGQVVTWFLLRSQGAGFVGDQVHYLIAGQALSHLSLHPLPYYQRDFASHFLYQWPAGASVTNHGIVQTFPGPHGSVFAHGIGLPLLLSPFIAAGSIPLALLGFFALNAAAFVWLHQRASELAGLSARGRGVFALVLAAPALWLAATQVYPDLISGALIACALVELGRCERDRVLSRPGAVILALTVAFVPWLQIKNLAPALLVLVALSVMAVRQQALRRTVVVIAAMVIASWLLLLAYNEYFFSTTVGLPQPNPTFDLSSLSNVLALLFDRDQGLVVQVPTVIIGAVGLWLSRRAIPLATATAALGVLLVLVINGTYTTGVPFGGVALAGRFEWTMAPMLLAWAPFALARIDVARVRMVALSVVVAVLWTAQGIPILLGHHPLYNETFAPFAPWDPSLYPGWWPALSQVLPTFLSPGIHLASTWTHLLAELLIVGALALVVVRLTRPEPIKKPRGATVVVVLLVLAGVVLWVGPARTQPRSTLSWPGSNLGAPWTTAVDAMAYPPIPLVDVGPGTYRGTFTYSLVAPGTGVTVASLLATAQGRPVVTNWLTPGHPTDAALASEVAAPIDLDGVRTASVRLQSPAAPRRAATLVLHVTGNSLISFQIRLGPQASATVGTLHLAKVTP